MKYGIYFAYWENEWDAQYLPYVKRVKDLGFDILEISRAEDHERKAAHRAA